MINKIVNRLHLFAKISKRRSIQYMLSISFTTVAVIAMTSMGTALYLRFSSSTTNTVIEGNSKIIEQVNLNLDTYLRNMMRISDSIYYRGIKAIDLENESLEQPMELLYEANRDSLISIAIFKEDGDLVSAYPVATLKSDADVSSQTWFTKADKKIENLHFSIPHVQDLFEDMNFRYRWVVSLSRAIELTRNGSIERGVLLVDMNFNAIEQLFKKVNNGQEGYIYLTDNNGEIIYHPRQQLIYSDLVNENNLVAASYDDGDYTEVFESEKRLITVKTAGYTGWKIVCVTPMSELIMNTKNMKAFMILILIFTIFLMVFADIFISAQIANPIKRLDESVKDLENGVLDGEVYIGGSHEIRHLGRTISSVVKQMKKLMDKIVVEQEQKRKSELDALQSQINPHFLYNTLDSIIWMVECERYEEAILMVTSLANLFRISLSKGKNIISVNDELEHAKNYLRIQKMRYKNRFVTKLNIAEEVLTLSSIKLIVQPLLENAIYYGMEYMDGDGEITVNAFCEENDLYIEVIDNGLGIPMEEIPLLLTNNARVQKKGSGVGLRNVHDRIQLYFGNKYGLEITSELDVGTTIRIHLPKVEYNTLQGENEAKKG